MADNEPTYDFYSKMELVEDTVKFENRRRTYAVLTSNIYVRTFY